MSRRRVFDSSLYDELDVITIPAGTRLHLWDNNDITDAHFISSGDLNVLVRKGHGSMYKLIQQYSNPDMNIDLIDDIRSIPIVKRIVSNPDKIQLVIDMLTMKYRNEVDAILMAYTTDGKVGLHFIQEGSEIPIDVLLQ